jgi:hypothetical protein
MVWIHGQAFWLCVPASTDVFVGGKAFERLGSLGEVVSHLEGLEMFLTSADGSDSNLS